MAVVAYLKKIWLNVKGYNEKIYYQDDYDFWLKIIKKNFQINHYNKALYIYNKHDANMSKNILKKSHKIKCFFIKPILINL